ncbi:MAG: hypothetical protein H0T54_01015 [Geodermatophilaceae bacterium]|nr:hypothetical protein [Geodermatophilaceae bacterium]
MSQPPYPPQSAPGDPNSGYQNPGYPQPGLTPPGVQYLGGQQPGGQYPGGQQPGGPYPGYQNAPPTGYGAGGGMPPPPPGWGAPPPPQALARPTTVTYALIALVANMVFGLISAILIFSNRDAYLQQAFRDAGLDPTTTAAASDFIDAGYRVGAIIGLIFVAIWALIVWFAWKGHNWARIVIWVFGGLSLIGVFTAFSSPVGIVVVLNVVNLLLVLAAVVMLALKPSNDWYRYQGDARKYNWPGRA